jgi:hypothetical protein
MVKGIEAAVAKLKEDPERPVTAGVLRARARREEVEALSTMKGMDLADPVVMSGAWRS